jgi:hypothetical protein
MSTDLKPHLGLGGLPCDCTKHRRSKARRGCSITCDCHHVAHAKCPRARPCYGRCGRLTTTTESVEPGFCVHCAAAKPFSLTAEKCVDELERDYQIVTTIVDGIVKEIG